MFDVALAPPETADDSSFVAVLCELSNDAYDRAESGLWRQTIGRTSSFDVASRLRTGDVLIAMEHDHPVAIRVCVGISATRSAEIPTQTVCVVADTSLMVPASP